MEKLKTEWSWLDYFSDELEEAAQVLTIANASGVHKGNSFLEETVEHQWDCLRRHLRADQKGETLDPVDGKPHLAHALDRLLFMWRLKRLKSTGSKMEEVR